MLKISHLQKNYRGFSLECSMEVQPGMITGLIGRNGSGKSTTFKALLGLIHPDGGVKRKSSFHNKMLQFRYEHKNFDNIFSRLRKSAEEVNKTLNKMSQNDEKKEK